VERQLVESIVIAGSALEHLIRDNQDFSMLRLEEAHDGPPFPPWRQPVQLGKKFGLLP